MNKYISFLLVPILLLGINSNSCYSMEDCSEEIYNQCNLLYQAGLVPENYYIMQGCYNEIFNAVRNNQSEVNDIFNSILSGISVVFLYLLKYVHHYSEPSTSISEQTGKEVYGEKYSPISIEEYMAYKNKMLKQCEFLYQPIQAEVVKFLYKKSHYKNLHKKFHYFKQYERFANDLQTQCYMEIIKILTGIDVNKKIESISKNEVNKISKIKRNQHTIEKTNEDMIIEEIGWKIRNNINTGKIQNKMKKVVYLLTSKYLPALEMCNKYITEFTKYLYDNYRKTFGKVYRNAERYKESYYDTHIYQLSQYILEFNNKYMKNFAI